MAKSKRRHDDTGDGDTTVGDQSASKRLKRSDDDDELARLYNDLADDVQIVRIKAAGELLKFIASDSQQRGERLGSAQQRLIRGLCSGRKAARLGFSIALTELFRLSFSASGDGPQIRQILSDIDRLTTPEGKIGGQERRDHLIGRRFAFQALLQSDLLLQPGLSQNEWGMVVEAITSLAAQKQWLRREVLGMLHDYLKGPSAKDIETDRLALILRSAHEKQMLTTPEGVGLWLTIQGQFPATPFPKKVWRKDSPLSKKSLDQLRKVLADDSLNDEHSTIKSGTRQTMPSFEWAVMLSQMYEADEDGSGESNGRFADFWSTCVLSLYFSDKSSSERRALGLQIFSLAIATAPASLLTSIVDGRIIRCIQDQRSKPDNTLFESAKTTLNQMVARVTKTPDDAFLVLQGLLETGVRNFDQKTKTKTVESIVAAASNDSLVDVIAYVQKTVLDGNDIQGADADTGARRHTLADVLLLMVRTHKDDAADFTDGSLFEKRPLRNTEDASWLGHLLDTLSRLAYADATTVPVFQPKLMSILNILMTGPLRQALQAPVFVARKAEENALVKFGITPKAGTAVDKAFEQIHKMYTREMKEGHVEVSLNAGEEPFALLFSLSILQVYNDEADAAGVLEDLLMCYDSLGEGGDSMTILVELLLSFVSKQSALYRKLAEQVFTAVASEVTADSLQSLLDILEQKESLTGQQQLFDSKDGEEEEDQLEADEVDLDDMSDVELVNGEPTSTADSEDEEDGDSDEDSSSDASEGADNEGNDEEAIFDKKLAEALGTGRLESDESDEDGSDMDDEQMLALEPHLTSIFNERQKNTSKKQERKDAKENIVNFKNRVIDLLAIFVKSQHSTVLALDTILPLVRLVRTTTNKQTGEKASAVLKQYFEACSKKKEYPQPEDSEVMFEVLANVHDEMKRGGSKLHANACSRSSLFIAKVLVGMDQSHYGRIAEMYATMMSVWWQNPKSKVQPSIFTEWTSWSITTRKQA